MGIPVKNKEQTTHAGIELLLSSDINPNNENVSSIRTETMMTFQFCPLCLAPVL